MHAAYSSKLIFRGCPSFPDVRCCTSIFASIVTLAFTERRGLRSIGRSRIIGRLDRWSAILKKICQQWHTNFNVARLCALEFYFYFHAELESILHEVKEGRTYAFDERTAVLGGRDSSVNVHSRGVCFKYLSMASFLLSEVFIVEKIISSGHADLDDLTCEATVCTEAHQAYCEATKHMIQCALEKNCDNEEEESLRYELVKAMRRRGLSAEKRYQRIKEVIISASRTFSAEKTYFNVKRTPILAACVVDEERMITDALQLLGESESKDPSAAGCSSSRKATPRDKSMKGRGRMLPPLPANEEGLSRMKRARFDSSFRLHH